MYTCRQGANAGSVFVEALLRIRRLFINAEVKKGVPAGRCVQNSRRQYALSKKEESDFNVERYSDSAYLIGLAAEGKIAPVIDACYPLAETVKAFRSYEKEHPRGKIVITMGDRS